MRVRAGTSAMKNKATENRKPRLHCLFRSEMKYQKQRPEIGAIAAAAPPKAGPLPVTGLEFGQATRDFRLRRRSD